MIHSKFSRWLAVLGFALLPLFLVAQNASKSDVVTKLNGDQLTGKVLDITDSTIRFSYTGETLIYTLKKSDIQKITFASGRTETINEPRVAVAANNAAPATSTAEERRNKVAILPFTFIKDGQNTAQELSEEIQNECYSLLSKHSGVYTILSPRATNVALNKAGISKANIMNFSMSEICEQLGVEYVVDGMVTQNTTSQSNYGNASYNDKTEKKGNSDDKKSSGNTSSYSTSVQNYQTTMDLKIYNDKSNVVYGQNRKAFWNTQDAYKNVLEYLIKRSPLYTK